MSSFFDVVEMAARVITSGCGAGRLGGGLAVRAVRFETDGLVGEQEATRSLNRAAQRGIKMAPRSV